MERTWGLMLETLAAQVFTQFWQRFQSVRWSVVTNSWSLDGASPIWRASPSFHHGFGKGLVQLR